MRPSIDHFFEDADFGRIKFAGYHESQYLFHAYERMSRRNRVTESRYSVIIHPLIFAAKWAAGAIKQSVPPC